MWALYALTAALLTSFLPIINKRILARADVAVVAWVPNVLSLPLLLAATLILIGWPRVDGLLAVGIVASGVLNLVATLASTRALQLADASVATTLLTVLLLFPAIWRKRSNALGQIRRQQRGFLLAGLLSGIAPLFGFSAIALGYVGYVTALFKLGAVFTVVWGTLLLKEHGLRKRFPATVVMVIGGVLIAL